jgi:hypothetical protein
VRVHFNFVQRIAAVVLLGFGAYLLGTWMTSLGPSVPRGSFTYSNSTSLGLSTQLQMAIWIPLFVSWAVVSSGLLMGFSGNRKGRLHS